MLGRIEVDTSVAHAAAAGERLELLVRRAARRRVRLTGRDVSSLVEATTVAVLVRSTVDGATGCATATSADPDSVAWTVRRARELRVTGPITLPPRARAVDAPPANAGWAALDALVRVGAADSVDRLLQLHAAARCRGAERTSTTWDHVAEVVTVANSDGLDLTYAHPELTLAIKAAAAGRGVVGLASRTASCPSAIDVDDLADEANGERMGLAGGAVTGRPGRACPSALVFAPRAWSKLLSQIGAVFYGDRPDLTRSGLRVLGERVTALGVDLVDDGTDSSVLAVAPCDDEGVVAQRTAIIEAGHVRSLLHDLGSPDYERGESSTGNGWMVPAGSGVGFGIAIAGSVLRLDGPRLRLAVLLAAADPLVYVTRVDDGNGRGVDAVQDVMRLTVSGWLVRGGEPAEPVTAAAVGLRLTEFLRRIRAISDVRQYYRVAAGSTLRKGPAVCATHVLVEDVPITLREDR